MTGRPLRRLLGRVRAGWVVSSILLGVGIVLLFVPVSPVALTWETASEVGTAGFNVYRAPASAAASDHAWTKVNDALIPAQGDGVVGARYRYEDQGLQPGRLYRYQIEEVEWDGSVTRFPEVVEVRAGLPTLWVRVEGVVFLLIAFLVFRRTLRGEGPSETAVDVQDA